MKPFILFFGPSGAGKTTQIKILSRKLRVKYGKGNIEVISIRDKHLLIPLVSKFLIWLGLYTHFRYGDRRLVVVADVQRVARDKRIWAIFQLINLLPVYFIRYYLNRKLWGKLLIADRFIQDSLSTLAHFLDDPNILKTRIGRLYLKLIPLDACLIFLYSSYNVLTIRYRNRGTLIEPQDLIRYEVFIGMKLSSNALMINTSDKSIIETANIIDDYLIGLGIL